MKALIDTSDVCNHERLSSAITHDPQACPLANGKGALVLTTAYLCRSFAHDTARESGVKKSKRLCIISRGMGSQNGTLARRATE